MRHRLSCRRVVVGLLLLAATRADAQSSRVEIWIRTFIPDPAHAGTTAAFIEPAPNGAGSMLRLQALAQWEYMPAPVRALLARYDAYLNQCFATDHRGFSTDSTASARSDARLFLTVTGNVTATKRPVVAGVTHRLDCASGAQIATAPGAVVRDQAGTPAFADGVGQWIGGATVTNAIVRFSPTDATPSIDYSYDVRWTPSSGTLNLDLTYGRFPAVEVYARQPGGPWIPVVQQLPGTLPLNTPLFGLAGDVWGVVTDRAQARVIVPGLGGTWRTAAPEQRFTVTLKRTAAGLLADFTERDAAGNTLTRTVPATELADGAFRFERANDATVLTFLGFQPTLRGEILARGPQPSFVVLRGDGAGGLQLEWNGLTVTKDAAAHLKELIQPGTRPAKPFPAVRAP